MKLLNNVADSVGMSDIKSTRCNIKFGMDPTAPDIHLGHAVVLSKLREFQDAGHHVQLVVGSFTAQIGDPTGKNKTRPPLTFEQVTENAKSYIEQAFLVLDKDKTSVHYNHQWLGSLSSIDTVKLMSHVTVSQILARDDFSKRMDSLEPVAMHELVYPLMQGYDSVHLKSDIEFGGTDQWFNLHMGRALQEKYGQKPQAIITMPILVGVDGVNKMSKSLNNHIGLKDSPNDMFGKWMSVSDETMWKMIELLTFLNTENVQTERNKCLNGLQNPMNVKMMTAKMLVQQFHGDEIAIKAEEFFKTWFSSKNKEFKDKEVYTGTPIQLAKILKNLELAESVNDAKRKIEQGGVKINGDKVTDPNMVVNQNDHFKLEVGKRAAYNLKITFLTDIVAHAPI